MTDTIGMAQNRNTAVVHNVTDKAVASAGNDQVNQRIFLQHLCDIFTCFQKLGGIRRKTVFRQSAANQVTKNLICMKRFTSAFQQDSVPAFNTQGRNLNKRVRTAFKNNSDNPDRTGNAIKPETFCDFSCGQSIIDRIRKIHQRIKT